MIVRPQVTELAFFFRISCHGGIYHFILFPSLLTGKLCKRAPADVGVLVYLPHSYLKSACAPHSSVSLGPTPLWTQFWLCYVWTTIQTLLLVCTPELCVYSSSSAVRLLMSHCVGSQCGSTWWLCSLLTKTTANLNPFVLNDLCFGLSIFWSFLPWFHSLRQWLLLHGCFLFVSKFHSNSWLSGLVFTRTYVKICWLKEALTQWCRNFDFFSIENWWNCFSILFLLFLTKNRLVGFWVWINV